jgi:hypothetical protein
MARSSSSPSSLESRMAVSSSPSSSSSSLESSASWSHPSTWSSKACQSITGRPRASTPITSLNLAGPTSESSVYVVCEHSSAPYTGSSAVNVTCRSHWNGSSEASESDASESFFSESFFLLPFERSPFERSPLALAAPSTGQCTNLLVCSMGNNGERLSTAHAMVCTPETVAGCITSTVSFFMNPSPSAVTCRESNVQRMVGLYRVWQRKLPTRTKSVGTPSLLAITPFVDHTRSFCGLWNFATTAANTNTFTTTPASIER